MDNRGVGVRMGGVVGWGLVGGDGGGEVKEVGGEGGGPTVSPQPLHTCE